MELQAAIAALNCIREPCQIEFFTDSEYLEDGISTHVAVWKARGWKRGKKSVKNEDLWKRLDQEVAKHQISWKWLKGHAGHPLNDRCDELARGAISAIRRELGRAQLQELLTQFQKTRSAEKDQGQLF
jgi:ribonuclease HI